MTDTDAPMAPTPAPPGRQDRGRKIAIGLVGILLAVLLGWLSWSAQDAERARDEANRGEVHTLNVLIATARDLVQRGIEFLSTDKVHTTERGALTAPMLGGMMFELVHTRDGK